MRKPKLPEDIRAYFARMGAEGGRIGAERRMEKISPERRREIARNAIAARWAKRDAKAVAAGKSRARA
jgi:hypothetical protein